MDKKNISEEKSNWFKLHPVLTIVFCVVIVFILIWGFRPLDSSVDSRSNYDINELKENSSISFLAEKGYDVLSLSFSSYSKEMAIQNKFTTDTRCYPYRGVEIAGFTNETCWSNYTQAYVKMKSLGNRNSQIWDALIAFANYKDVFIYRIDILTPTETCTYYITGKTYDAYLNVDIINNYSEENLQLARELAQKVDAQIDKYKTCS